MEFEFYNLVYDLPYDWLEAQKFFTKSTNLYLSIMIKALEIYQLTNSTE
jgi:hypothetical protein